MSKIHSYRNGDLTIHYDVRRCIHAAECVRGLPAVFNPKNRPWVDPSAADDDAIAAVVERCPTGALRHERAAGPAEAVPTENVIRLAANGPAYLRGDLEIEDAEGTVHRHTRIALCRCGGSRAKPFCDNSHHKVGFEDAATVGTLKVKEEPQGQTALRVKIRPDGPLILSGPFRIVDGAGETAAAAGNCALCRCGRSGNRPFCDGSHNAGFEDPGVVG